MRRGAAAQKERGGSPLLGILKMVTPGAQDAVGAVGLPGPAHRPAVEDQPVAEVVGLLRGQAGPQLFFHLARVFGAVGEAQQAGDADAVGVRHDGGTSPRIRLAVFRPTPGKVRSSSMVPGTLPWYFSSSIREAKTMSRALARKKPQEWM